jgi:hypothetical protein
MYRTLRLCLLLLGAVLLQAADSSWKARPIPQWDEEDAKQVLADSPWVKYVTPEPLPGLSPNACRDGGDWKGCTGKGVGLAGTGLLGARREAEAIARAHAKPHVDPVAVRWESALPVRAAEQKLGLTGVPIVDGDHYAIAVYGIPTPKRWNLARELRGIAFLKRDKKKDLKPSRVEILRHSDGTATLVYLFPGSVEIGKRDGWLEFRAQIGRLFVSQFFCTDDMQLQGKLELLTPSNGPR